MRIVRKKNKDLMPELQRSRDEEKSYISMYQSHDDDLEALMTLDQAEDQQALDKAWTAKNPEL
ncbi:MAG: hypothetical protein ACRBBW_17130 [Cellvibrionaceae bacterium]